MIDNICQSCARKILWVKTLKGKTMPVDAEPAENGNLDISSGKAVVIKPGEYLPGIPLYTSHFATCPHSAQHRSKKA